MLFPFKPQRRCQYQNVFVASERIKPFTQLIIHYYYFEEIEF